MHHIGWQYQTNCKIVNIIFQAFLPWSKLEYYSSTSKIIQRLQLSPDICKLPTSSSSMHPILKSFCGCNRELFLDVTMNLYFNVKRVLVKQAQLHLCLTVILDWPIYIT